MTATTFDTTIDAKKKNVFVLFLIVLLSFGAALTLNFMSSQAAYAGDGIGVDTGGGTPNPPGGGGDGGGGGPSEPTYRDSTEAAPPSNYRGGNFSTDCERYSTGGWARNASCSASEGFMVPRSPYSPQRSQGSVPDGIIIGSGSFTTISVEGQVFGTTSATCGPDGNGMAASSMNWNSRIYDSYQRIIRRYSDGRTETIQTRLLGTSVFYSFNGCSYPQPQVSHKVCYWNYGGNIRYSMNKDIAIGSWSHYSNRTPLASDPGQPSFSVGSGPQGGYCTEGPWLQTRVETRGNVDPLGYYSAYVRYDWNRYARTDWVAGGRTFLTEWAIAAGGTGSNRSYFSYSCRPGQANAVQGAFPNAGSMPNVDGYLNPANCPQVTWQCVLDNPTTIGLERTAVISGSLSPTTRSTVMRNGEKVNIDFSRVRVVDTSTPSDIDVTNGGQAPSIRNVSNIAYRTHVADGSTPFYGKDPNAAQQYFTYYNARTGETKEKFDQWISNNNANLDKSISFNWASTSASQPFELERTYRVTAEFFVPGGSSVGNNGAGGPTSYQWKEGTYDCRDYQGRGLNRVDRGPLVSSSNPVEVVRSVNQ